MTGPKRKRVAIPLLDVKGTVSKENGEKLRADGEEEITKVLKEKGWKKEEGPCVSLIAKCKEGKVEGMKLKTSGGKARVWFEMDKVWEMSAKVKAVIEIDLDTLVFPGEGKSPRNLSEWQNSGDLEVEYYKEGEGEGDDNFAKEDELSQEEEEELGIGEKPFVARAVLTPGDAFRASLHVTILPVAKSRLQEVLDSWAISIKAEDECIPGFLCQRVEKGPGQENWKDEWSLTLKILPQEEKSDKIGLGILPILECKAEDKE